MYILRHTEPQSLHSCCKSSVISAISASSGRSDLMAGRGSDCAATIAKVIDLKAARQDREGYRAALARRGAAQDFDELLAADENWRECTERAESLRAEQKKASRGKPGPDELARLKELSATIETALWQQAEAAQLRDEILGRIPNPPDPMAADGMDEED